LGAAGPVGGALLTTLAPAAAAGLAANRHPHGGVGGRRLKIGMSGVSAAISAAFDRRRKPRTWPPP